MAKPIEFETVALAVCHKTGMYVQDSTFASVIAFLQGFDLARDGGPLTGFREWLVVRDRSGNNLHWAALVRRVLDLPKEFSHVRDQRVAIKQLGKLLEEFFACRNQQGVDVIFDDYRRWLLKQTWYDGPLRKRKTPTA